MICATSFAIDRTIQSNLGRLSQRHHQHQHQPAFHSSCTTHWWNPSRPRKLIWSDDSEGAPIRRAGLCRGRILEESINRKERARIYWFLFDSRFHADLLISRAVRLDIVRTFRSDLGSGKKQHDFKTFTKAVQKQVVSSCLVADRRSLIKRVRYRTIQRKDHTYIPVRTMTHSTFSDRNAVLHYVQYHILIASHSRT